MFVNLVITGTGTGAGKTVLAALLVRRLLEHGISTAAFKPLCSGGRADAEALYAALGGREADINVINPWHFRAPLAPALAARLAGEKVSIASVAGHIAKHSREAGVAVVECAGGLLSPLTADGDAPELIRALKAVPVIVAENRLGVIHDVRATLAVLPPATARRAVIVLNDPGYEDPSRRHNAPMLEEYFVAGRIFQMPRLKPAVLQGGPIPRHVRRLLDEILACSGIATPA